MKHRSAVTLAVAVLPQQQLPPISAMAAHCVCCCSCWCVALPDARCQCRCRVCMWVFASVGPQVNRLARLAPTASRALLPPLCVASVAATST